jgi:hypothetical protein
VAEAPTFLHNRHMKVIRLSAVSTGRFYLQKIFVVLISVVGWDSVVGIATRYGLDGPGIESLWGIDFSAPVQTAPGFHPASYTVSTGSHSRG